ncbi:MAG: helix-turn-helix domain-containing protein [Jannaschia sp.]
MTLPPLDLSLIHYRPDTMETDIAYVADVTGRPPLTQVGLFYALLSKPGMTLHKVTLARMLEDVTGYGDHHDLPTVVKRGRKHLVKVGLGWKIVTVWGVGYALHLT